MGNLEELYKEAGLKRTSEGSKMRSGLLKVMIYLAMFGLIIYWAFSTSVFGSNKSQPYYFSVIAAVFLFIVIQKITSFWKIIKQNKKFLKPE
mgnify:CR=1 FL=1